jgi:signal transduction histidine kinase
MRVIILICGTVLIVTCVGFFAYELYAFRKSTVEKLKIISGIISSNSTAALAFQDRESAAETLMALRNEPHVAAAALYDENGKLFAKYPANIKPEELPKNPKPINFRFSKWRYEGTRPVMQDEARLGALYIRTDISEFFERMRIFAFVMVGLIALSFLVAILFSGIIRRNISAPVLALAGTATHISEHRDYSVRAIKWGNDELGSLTDSFNGMLDEIEAQNKTLKEFNQNLERKVLERTAQLEAVNRELESFSYSISHDLRAPLRGIVGFTTILEEDYGNKFDDEARRITSVIKSNTLKMGHLIDDLLTFSRMGRQDIIKTKIDTNAMVREVIDYVIPVDKKEHIDWQVHDLPEMKADINAIRQVWVNLISNAVKYSGSREHQQIEIGSFSENNHTTFFVKDNGVGFDEKYKEKLFRVFQRLHSADEFEGTGVGLAIVDKIVSKHGGKVAAEGRLNNGATFYFNLPND